MQELRNYARPKFCGTKIHSQFLFH